MLDPFLFSSLLTTLFTLVVPVIVVAVLYRSAGPADCPIPKLKNRFRRHILIKFPGVDSLLAFADEHGEGLLAAARVKRSQKHAEVRVTLDVDPVNMM